MLGRPEKTIRPCEEETAALARRSIVAAADLLAAVADRVAAYRTLNALGPDVAVPVDAVTASGSGLDPHISVANAQLQASRVAAERGLAIAEVLALIDQSIDGRAMGVLGEPGVNVLRLNLALDEFGT